MAGVRMQARYWKLLLPGIELAREELRIKYERWGKILANPQHINDEEMSAYKRRMDEIYDDMRRYDAIEKLVREASEKRDSFFSVGIGPDEPDYDTPTQDEEEKLRWLEQID